MDTIYSFWKCFLSDGGGVYTIHLQNALLYAGKYEIIL